MGNVGYAPLVLDGSDVVEKIVSDLSRVEDIRAVEWIQQSVYSLYQDIIRIETCQGAILRLGLSWVEDEEVEEDFDDAFRQYFLEKSFEMLECSCAAQRLQLEHLEAQFYTELLRFCSGLTESSLGQKIAVLKREIAEIDRIEHPLLDKMAVGAYPYIDLWIAEQESSVIEGLGTRELIFQYAQEWRAGWRPAAARAT